MVDRKTLLALLLPLPFAALPLILVIASMGPGHSRAVVAIQTVPTGQRAALGATTMGASYVLPGVAALPVEQPCSEGGLPLVQG